MTSGLINEETLPEDVYRKFIGGVGLGAKVISERMNPSIDLLGLDSILGFVTGSFNAISVLMSPGYNVGLKDAGNLWGIDAVETTKIIHRD